MRNQRIILSLCLLLLITSFSLLPCIENDFTNWDDDLHVTANTSIKSLSLNNIKTIFTSSFVGCYAPLAVLSYVGEYYFFQLNPFIYHSTNLILHLCNCILTFWMIYLITQKSLVAFFVALLFSIHPLHVESVAWVSERKDVLYAFFYLSSIVSYLYYLKNQYKSGLYCLSLILCVLSLLSKPMAVSLPFVLVLIDYLFSRRFDRRSILEKLPFLFVVILCMVIALYSAYTVMQKSFFHTFPENIFIGTYNILFYLTKMVLPINLSAFYAYPDKISGRLPLLFLTSPFIVALLLGSVMWFMRRKRYVMFGVLFFLVTIFPVLQFIPAGYAMAADRYTYIPLTGIFFLIVSGIYELYQEKSGYAKRITILLSVVCLGIVALFTFLTWQRCLVWHNSITLWNDVLKKDPHNIIAYNNLGSHYLFAGEYQSAISYYKKAIAINPHYAQAHNNVCSAYLSMHKLDDAFVACRNAIVLKPHYEDALINMGKIYHAVGRYDDAIKMYRYTHGINPHNAESYNELCSTYLVTGNYKEASHACQKALSLKPHIPEAYINLGTINVFLGKHEEAILLYKKAIGINPNYGLPYANLCRVYKILGRQAEALDACNTAVTLLPHSAESFNDLGNVYLSMGDYTKALDIYNRAITVDPSFGASYNNLAVLYYYYTKQYGLAAQYSSRAIELGHKVHPEFLELLKPYQQKKQ